MNPVSHDIHRTSLPDLIAFGIGIGVAWWTGWDTLTLVWSLWLSSLVVGFISIIIGIVGTARSTQQALINGLPDASATASTTLARIAGPLAFVYGMFLLAFFTLHFGGFHWGHSIFLNMFFPLDGSDPATRQPFMQPHEYLRVIELGWWFIPLALIAERKYLFGTTASGPSLAPDARMSAPYRNVVCLHLLIFFFAFTMFTGMADVWVYLLVYAVYFFPWKAVFRRSKHRRSTDDTP